MIIMYSLTSFISTPDTYPVGSIRTKYDQVFSSSSEFKLPELPVYGQDSLLSRTVVISEVVKYIFDLLLSCDK